MVLLVGAWWRARTVQEAPPCHAAGPLKAWAPFHLASIPTLPCTACRYIVTDGVGRMALDVAERIMESLGLGHVTPPRAVQVCPSHRTP